MEIKEIYKKIFGLSSKTGDSAEDQYEIDSKIEVLIEQANTKIGGLSDEEKDKILLPLLKDFHKQKFRSLILRTLENVSTINISSLLLDKILFESDVSGVIPYLLVFSGPNVKNIIKEKANNIYVSGEVNSGTKEFNNLCTLLFYIGIRQDVANDMKDNLDTLEGTSKELISGILQKYKF